MQARKLTAEALGTALLVFIGAGVATLSFGFDMTESSPAAGVVATALAFGFGFVMLILAYALGPISGAHINPAVTMGFLLSRRISPIDAVGYWVAQVIGAIIRCGDPARRGLRHAELLHQDGRPGR